ncbi:MAG: Gfo/Idh/MocA family oxidoreductase [Lachnospiraceae bacterium]|nr:Gfo/Idh/MocA family oxidoreductase [Lachnospiraceae bacterium]
MEKMKVGLIGCGMISEIYLKNCTQRFGNMEIKACADINRQAAEKRAGQFGIQAMTVEELLADPEIELVLNLTVPDQHGPVGMRILNAGKHVYSEKPFATSYEEASALLNLAKSKNLYAGSAPDTFMGDGMQMVRSLLDSGAIGRAFAAQAFLLSRGPEYFHPNPEFLYKEGAGPLMDWGPYYITALIALFGPVKSVYGSSRKPYGEKEIKAPGSPRKGQKFPVEVPTYITSILEFTSGMMANLTVSFDLQCAYWESHMPYIQIYGTEGTISVPDVNSFAGPVLLRKGGGEFEEVEVKGNFTENCRGMGLCEMIHGIRTGQPWRTEGSMGAHVTEVMLAIMESAKEKRAITLKTTCELPKPLSPDRKPEMYTD